MDLTDGPVWHGRASNLKDGDFPSAGAEMIHAVTQKDYEMQNGKAVAFRFNTWVVISGGPQRIPGKFKSFSLLKCDFLKFEIH